MILESSRQFKIWDANPTHAQLLLRSHKNDSLGISENIDVQFRNVKFICLAGVMEGITISIADESERTKSLEWLPKSYSGDKVYVIISNSKRYFVIAGICLIDYNDLHIMKSSIENDFTTDF